jgi:hypothetical protein
LLRVASGLALALAIFGPDTSSASREDDDAAATKKEIGKEAVLPHWHQDGIVIAIAIVYRCIA